MRREMKCPWRHTEYQPSDNEFLCPQCGSSEFFIDCGPGVDEVPECEQLHEEDVLRCEDCGCDVDASEFASMLVEKRAEMGVPVDVGYYRVKIRVEEVDEEGKGRELDQWEPAYVFINEESKVVFSVIGSPEVMPLDCEKVVEWGSEIEVDEFRVFMDRLESKVDSFAPNGVVGKFEGVEVSEKFTKKALLGIIVALGEWDRRTSMTVGGGQFHPAFRPIMKVEDYDGNQ